MLTIRILIVLSMLTACLRPPSSLQSSGASSNPGDDSHNLLANGRFHGNKSVPWATSFTAPGTGESVVDQGALCVRLDDPGQNRWDAQIRHREMVLRRGHRYTVRFKAWASAPTYARPKVGMAGPPYAEYWAETIQLDAEPRAFEAGFTMKGRDDPTAELAFHLGGELAKSAPLSVCVDDVVLDDPEFTRAPTAIEKAVPKALVNQVGYLKGHAKVAIFTTESEAPAAFEVLDQEGAVVGSGSAILHGLDAASGKTVQRVDFSTVDKVGDYVLRVGDELSHPFAISAAPYRKLKYDALAYFYHNRSGIEIKLPYAGKPIWARPAGHLSDQSVSCVPGSGCDHTLDVSGGWYDAGDHGKYVVNGGISVWTLVNQYERLARVGRAKEAFADGSMNIPESKNGMPDLLDEARWELEFMLKMQIPNGKLAGLVHHKVHNVTWTALPLRPDQDKVKRYLYPPSTAATLNLAATAAQAARVYREFDQAFAQRCLVAAERAYKAAKAHPNLFAPEGGVGGGPYDDRKVGDEFYWAESELFITTGSQAYREAMERSPYFNTVTAHGKEGMGGRSAMTWQNTESLGTLSLALVPTAMGDAETKAARAAVKAAADDYLGVHRKQGFRVPFEPSKDGSYPWGSNASVLNNMIVLALAHDFTGDEAYFGAVVGGMDYLLGMNPLGQSYVTGYGARPTQNPHHRFWAHSLDATFPAPPPGAIAGGPNSSVQDPYARGYGLVGCLPQTCYVDHIESYSTNEITINWNAPLAWVAAFLDDSTTGAH